MQRDITMAKKIVESHFGFENKNEEIKKNYTVYCANAFFL